MSATTGPVRANAPTGAIPQRRRFARRVVTRAQHCSAAQGAGAVAFSRRDALLLTLSAPLLIPALAEAYDGKVFVAGSTGNTGRRVVYELRRQGLPVRAGVRDMKKALGLGFGADSGVEVVLADVTKGVGPLEDAIGDAKAVICCTGFAGLSPNAPTKVDELGTKNLVDAAKSQGVEKFVLLSSLLTNAAALGQSDNPSYKFLNFFGGVLDHKLAAEKYLRSSGLDYTIVRPGGLSNDPTSEVGNLIVRQEDTLFALPEDPGRRISRDLVAEVLVQALLQPAASNRVVEIVSSPTVPALPAEQWFA